jgi:hypothetical protein
VAARDEYEEIEESDDEVVVTGVRQAPTPSTGPGRGDYAQQHQQRHQQRQAGQGQQQAAWQQHGDQPHAAWPPQQQQQQQQQEQDCPWWSLLPDFVPVEALAGGWDPRWASEGCRLVCINIVRAQLYQLRNKFIKRNPDFFYKNQLLMTSLV